MTFAYIMAEGRGNTDLILEGLAATLTTGGFQCVGTVQINTAHVDEGQCDMNVRVLPGGPVLRISQSLGRSARGCRLDPASLEMAVALVESRLTAGADLLIINKFGKHEAEGRGFRAVIARAVEMDLPVLVGVNALNRAAFEAFAEGLAIHLPPERGALADWVQDAVRGRLADA